MTLPVLDNRRARRLFLDRHGLCASPSGPGHGAALLKVITGLGFVQLDSINTVARAHDLILFSRKPRYRCADLQGLYERDRALFEHWTHDAAMIPMAFHPHWALRCQRDADRMKRRWTVGGYHTELQRVLDHVRDHGPVRSGDLGRDEPRGTSGWWDWSPSKRALDYLWRSGVLSVTGRVGFQKRYDLTERVIDNAPPAPDPQASIDWLNWAALDRLGFATSGEIAAFWETVTAAEARDWAAVQLQRGTLIRLGVTCADGAVRQVLARPDLLEQEPPTPPGRIRVLSPFDPALRDRKRAERLFGFHYRIEVFVPAAKRQYGYYVFPLLEGDRLIGRIDMKAQRNAGQLQVTALWPEPGVHWSQARTDRLCAELARVARLSDTPDIHFAPDWLR